MGRILVTGAAGYVGSGLVETLGDADLEVRALVREQDAHLDVEQVVADIALDPEAVAAACEGVDVVVHLAGENEVLAARDPASALGGTVLATERLVEAAGRARVSRVVYMSTIHVYGERIRDGATLSEDLRPEPRSTYAIARLTCEHLLATLRAQGSEIVVFRLTNSVGAPAHPAIDRWTLVANDLCRQGAVTGRLELRSSGMQWRDFVALSDVRGIVTAACAGGGAAVPPGTYNLGSGNPLTVRDLAGLVQDAFEDSTGERPPLHAPEPGPERPAPYHVDVERAAAQGLCAETPIAAAVDEAVRFCIEHRGALAG